MIAFSRLCCLKPVIGAFFSDDTDENWQLTYPVFQRNSQGAAFRQKAPGYLSKRWGCSRLIPSLLPFPSWLQFEELRRQRLKYLFSPLTLCLLLKCHLSKVSSTKHNDLIFNKSISKVSSTILPALFMKICIAGRQCPRHFFYSQLQVLNGLDWVNFWPHLKEGVWIDCRCRRVNLMWIALSRGRWFLASEQCPPWFFFQFLLESLTSFPYQWIMAWKCKYFPSCFCSVFLSQQWKAN